MRAGSILSMLSVPKPTKHPEWQKGTKALAYMQAYRRGLIREEFHSYDREMALTCVKASALGAMGGWIKTPLDMLHA
jgi:hypothetical protein